MKKGFYIFFAFCVACNQPDTAKLNVSGTVTNTHAKNIFLEETAFGNMQPVIVDSAKINTDGSYKLATKAKDETIYNLRLDQSEYPFVSFINDSKNITIDANFSNPNNLYTVKGSDASEALKQYLVTTGTKMRNLYNTNELLDSIQKTNVRDSLSTDSLATIYASKREQQAKDLKSYTTDFINKSNNAALTLFALGSYQSIASNPAFNLDGFSQPEITDIINTTASKFPTNKVVASLKTSLQNQQKQQDTSSAPVSLLNKPAPDFTLPDVNGKPVSLSSFKGKYVLVDFWASWCPPCRAENPNVVKAYHQYKDKNFAILGVSLDRPGQKDAWLKAIKDDNLAWTQVSDLKFWDSEVVNLYGFEGIPYNVLVDPKGIVIGESLRGEELESKLNEVLK